MAAKEREWRNPELEGRKEGERGRERERERERMANTLKNNKMHRNIETKKERCKGKFNFILVSLSV